jgi:3-hydroxybutyryl-CoA dehydrogenase
VAADLADLAPAQCVIEAVAEDLAVKQALFAQLEKVVSPGCVLATNTSSLSPTAIAAGLSHPGRLVGMHFFNPAPLMRLVEVVNGLATDPGVAEAVTALAEGWGKQVVQAGATPGFIVNRVARPFYAEALRLAEEQAASPATIDAVLTQAGGFKMGPFALMDLVGQDVNEAVTRSVWAAFGYDSRFAPSRVAAAGTAMTTKRRRRCRTPSPGIPSRPTSPRPGTHRCYPSWSARAWRSARTPANGTVLPGCRAGRCWCAATAGPPACWRPSGAGQW